MIVIDALKFVIFNFFKECPGSTLFSFMYMINCSVFYFFFKGIYNFLMNQQYGMFLNTYFVFFNYECICCNFNFLFINFGFKEFTVEPTTNDILNGVG